MEVTKAGNITGGKIRQLEEHCPANLINWQQISKMTKYLKKYILEMQFLKSKDRQRFITLHKTASNNYGTISYKIMKVLNISSSTVHTITKSFYESDGKG